MRARFPDGTRSRAVYCSVCTASGRTCVHPLCTNTCVPAFPKDKSPSYCAEHYANSQTSSFRLWPLCSYGVHGCVHLSEHARAGSCRLCAQNIFPCPNVIRGCSGRVRSLDAKPPHVVGLCVGADGAPCPFASVLPPVPSAVSSTAHLCARPKCACLNYPICKNDQMRARLPDGTRPRAVYCSACSASAQSCVHPLCTNTCVPPFPKDKSPSYCAEHYANSQTSSCRLWPLCSYGVHGCFHLSEHARGGSCHLCAQNIFPCPNVIHGCSGRVRSPDAKPPDVDGLCGGADGAGCQFASALPSVPPVDSSTIHLSRPSALSCVAPCAVAVAEEVRPTKEYVLSPTTAVVPSPSANSSRVNGVNPTCRPRHACVNYPICKNNQYQFGPRTDRSRSAYCATCYKSDRICTHPVCESKCVPAFKKDSAPAYCVVHYADVCHEALRAWPLCSNTLLGCRLLAVQPAGGKCRVCEHKYLPCAFATLGCSARSRPVGARGQRVLPACGSAASGMCPYDPAAPRKCQIPTCSSLCDTSSSVVCAACHNGCTPCPKLCGQCTAPAIAPCKYRKAGLTQTLA